MRIRTASFGAAPRDDPLSYPGRRPQRSFLFWGAEIEMVETYQALEERLIEAGASAVEDRCAVLVVGSNASPAQLASKLEPDLVPLPVVAVQASGVDAVYASHLTRYGAVPAAAHFAPGARLRTHVQLLDDAQLAAMDRSEGRNYERVPLPARVAVRFEIDLSVEAISVYVTGRPPLRVDGDVVRLGDLEQREAQRLVVARETSTSTMRDGHA